VVTIDEEPGTDVEELVAHARINGLRIIGPGSMGIASPRPDTFLQAALVDVRLPAGWRRGVDAVRHARQLAAAAGRDLRMGLSWFVSLGDKRDVSANDLLQFWEDDEATSVVALYTESLGNPKKFGRIARRVSSSDPIVASGPARR
jgi:acyl-CoA synthetase (NDP forming)